MRLLLGGGRFVVDDAGLLLQGYRSSAESGYAYLSYKSAVTPSDKVVPEDLAVTLLVNSQASWRAFQSMRSRAATLQLADLPARPLGEVTDKELAVITQVIGEMVTWPGFGASLATKVLHKKRPDLVPILDNLAIFGAYMNPGWPATGSSAQTVKEQGRIEAALRQIRDDMRHPHNVPAWQALAGIDTHYQRTPIQVFDSVWWMYFQKMKSQ